MPRSSASSVGGSMPSAFMTACVVESERISARVGSRIAKRSPEPVLKNSAMTLLLYSFCGDPERNGCPVGLFRELRHRFIGPHAEPDGVERRHVQQRQHGRDHETAHD